MTLTLQTARAIVDAALDYRSTAKMKPITIAVLDAGGHTKLLLREDGTSTLRPKVAHGKAHGAIALGLGSRKIFERAKEQPYFVDAVNTLAGGALVPRYKRRYRILLSPNWSEWRAKRSSRSGRAQNGLLETA